MDRRQLIGLSAALAAASITRASAKDQATAEQGGTMFRIGAIADAQYADQDDAGARMYRRTPAKLEEAVATLNKAGIDFAVHLGDFIDGDEKSYDTVLPLIAKLNCPVRFVLGNTILLFPKKRSCFCPNVWACRGAITALPIRAGALWCWMAMICRLMAGQQAVPKISKAAKSTRKNIRMPRHGMAASGPCNCCGWRRLLPKPMHPVRRLRSFAISHRAGKSAQLVERK